MLIIPSAMASWTIEVIKLQHRVLCDLLVSFVTAARLQTVSSCC
jgi:hypothetical protein